ncbi:MAG TPA: alkaline shock response membrane anchor protein AmaP [Limnochordia bacterium]|nr:alkaline shock response membrane anchor protein AmaP [Limnochordia bacterium]
MTLLDRVFLGICALVLVVFAGLLVATLLGSEVLLEWLAAPSFGFDGSLVAIILVLLAAYLVVVLARMDARKYIVYPRELGTVRISADSVESLIVEAASHISGVEQVKASFTDVVNPKVILKVTAYPDHNLGELSEEIQETVKSYLEKTVGVVIQEIDVSVVGISKKAETELHGIT